MGRRYGRNQKRRHREKIAELEAIQKRLLRQNTNLLNETMTLKAELKTEVETFTTSSSTSSRRSSATWSRR